MAFLGAILPYVGYAATAYSAISQSRAQKQQATQEVDRGRQAQIDANFEAAQAEQQAGQELAASQREAEEARRQSRVAQSRAMAVAAASGSTLDPSVVGRIGDIAEVGEYNAASAEYSGKDKAAGLRLVASQRRESGQAAYDGGQQASRALRKQSTTTLMNGAASIATKYASTR